jgi:hypothetical protein
MLYKMWAISLLFTTAAALAPAAFAADPAASRTEGGAVLYYPTLNEAFEVAAGTSIDTPDEITVLSDIILDTPIIIDTPKHIRLVAANGSKTIQRGSGNLENPLFRVLGNSASLTLGKPGMENELIIDGGVSQHPADKSPCPAYCRKRAKRKIDHVRQCFSAKQLQLRLGSRNQHLPKRIVRYAPHN